MNRLFRISLMLTAGILIAAHSPNLHAAPEAPKRGRALKGENPSIRVLIADGVTSMSVTPHQYWLVKSTGGTTTCELKGDECFRILVSSGDLVLKRESATAKDSDTTVLGPAPVVLLGPGKDSTVTISGWSPTSSDKRTYEGKIEVHPCSDGTLKTVCELPLEEYLRGVVPHEIGGTSPMQALCAQAVAARSEAVLALTSGAYSGADYDICSTVKCQAFSGLTKTTEASDAAVSATRGIILTFQGKPMPAFYSSNCAGYSEDIRNVWPDRGHISAYWDVSQFDGPTPEKRDFTSETVFRQWLKEDPKAYCNGSVYKLPSWAGSNFRWTRQYTADQLTLSVAKKHDIGRVTAIKALKRGTSGRINEAEFVGEKGSYKVDREIEVRQMFQPALRSGAFVVDTEGGTPGRPDVFVLHGGGSGHAVGMCQSGAIGMAGAAKDFREILSHYYPKAKLEKIY